MNRWKSEAEQVAEQILMLSERKGLQELKRRRNLDKDDPEFIGDVWGREIESEIALKGLRKASARTKKK